MRRRLLQLRQLPWTLSEPRLQSWRWDRRWDGRGCALLRPTPLVSPPLASCAGRARGPAPPPAAPAYARSPGSSPGGFRAPQCCYRGGRQRHRGPVFSPCCFSSPLVRRLVWSSSSLPPAHSLAFVQPRTGARGGGVCSCPGRRRARSAGRYQSGRVDGGGGRGAGMGRGTHGISMGGGMYMQDRQHPPSSLLQDGWTASIRAAYGGHLDALRTLLAAGANPAATSRVREREKG